MPSPEEMFSRLDANNDGSLSATEVNNSFMSRAFRDRDLSNGLSREQFSEEMQQMRERFGRGGSRGGSDSDRRERGGSGGEERGDRAEGAQGPTSEQTPTAGGSAPATATSGTPASTTSPRARITIDLQADLLAGDTDRDGQVGLYEWRKFAGRSLPEFKQLDLNGDGFVTPREYATVRPPPAPATTPAATDTATAGVPTAQPAPTDSAATTGNENAVAPPASGNPADTAKPADGRTTQDAERFFRLLDKNKDGQVVAAEWVDGRVRTMFSKDGIDLSQPLLAADFSRHYVRLSAND